MFDCRKWFWLEYCVCQKCYNCCSLLENDTFNPNEFDPGKPEQEEEERGGKQMH